MRDSRRSVLLRRRRARHLHRVAVLALVLVATAFSVRAPVEAPEPTASHTPPPAKSGPLSPEEQARAQQVSATLARFGDDLARHQTELSAEGLSIVSTVPAYSLAASTSSAVVMSRPYVLYDSQVARYYAVAKYHWNTSTGEYWAYDAKSTCGVNSVCNVGGPDGFALRYNQNVVNRSVVATFCPRTDLASNLPQFSGCVSPTNPDTNSSAGASYRWQDKVFKNFHSDYTMDSGQIMMQIDPIKCGTTLQMFSRYIHTWSSTSLTSFSVSLSSFSASFSSTSNHWAASSQSGTWTRC